MKHLRCLELVIAASLLASCVLHGATASASLVNLAPQDAPALVDAIHAEGLDVAERESGGTPFQGALLVWEARGNLPPEVAPAVGDYVRRGGSLLLGLDPEPGLTPFQFSFLSPTMAWSVQKSIHNLLNPGITTLARDPEFFGPRPGKDFSLPYFFSLRPFHTVERGIARYDRFDRKTPWLETDHPAGDFFWTRPLLNRDWKVRLQGNDRAASPLLLTGRYGAGRVAVFASGLDGKEGAPASFWNPVVKWLIEPPPVPESEPTPGSVQISTSTVPDTSAGDILRVMLKNTSDVPLTLQVVGRILTWEEAIIGDVGNQVMLPAEGSTSVDLALPKESLQQYQALDWRRTFVVRVGVLSASGATLVAEKVVPVDLSPPVSLELFTENPDRLPYPFPNAPGPDQPQDLSRRMGMPVTSYAYSPGQTVHASIVITNGLKNLAPEAQVTDETTPDNPSVMALNDEAAFLEKAPTDGVTAWGNWTGKAGVENVLHFHFPSPVTIGAVTLMGSPDDFRKGKEHNPGSVVIEGDGKEVARDATLDARFETESGLVRVAFPPVLAQDVRVHLPWSDMPAGTAKRLAPWLGEIDIEGNAGPPPSPASGVVTLILRDSLAGTEKAVGQQTLDIPALARIVWPVPVPLPDTTARFDQLEVRFNHQHRTIPLLAIAPKQTLTSLAGLRPADAPSLGFIVTRGFRNGFTLGTGTRESPPGWETPDDLVWAYSHALKQTGPGNKTKADWLYLTDTDLRHYSTPWTLFPDGESVMDLADPQILDTMKHDRNWAASDKALIFFSDRWDTGPSLNDMNLWQNFVAFDESLRTAGGPGLTGQTRGELVREINDKFPGQWTAWQETRYVDAVKNLRQTFTAAGKDLVISAQGIPLVSNAAASVSSQTIRGMSDDNTWGMEHESVPFTTGRQLAALAYNPEWELNLNFVWGYDSGVIGNLGFHSVVGTTEASRRHYDDVAWRGIINESGHYQSALTWGFGQNGGASFVMSLNDWQQLWLTQQRMGLIYPESPLGAGLIVSSAKVDAPGSIFFSGGGMGTIGKADLEIKRIAALFERLHDAGLSIPFTSNIMALRPWTGTAPLIIPDLSEVSNDEVNVLQDLSARGVRIAAFSGTQPLSPAAAALFGVTSDGKAAQAQPVGIPGPGAPLARGNCLFIPVADRALTLEMSQQLAPVLQQFLAIPLVFPEGTMGYGFNSGNQEFIVIEDWMEKGRTGVLRVHATGSQAHAVELNDHGALEVRRDGSDWLIEVPLRPGDGNVVILEETK